MRTLTAEAAAAAAATHAYPVLLLTLDFGGATGTKRYADRPLDGALPAEGRILEATPLEQLWEEAAGTAAAEVTLLDADGALRALLAEHDLAGTPATLARHFAGLGESDAVPLVEGVLAPGASWSEAAGGLRVRIEPKRLLLRDRPIGNRATRAEFSKLGRDEEGRGLPLVYGEVHRMRAVLVAGGASTELVEGAAASDTVLRVKDASRFPAGTIALRIGQEEMTGAFSGNTFTVASRPRVLASGTLSHGTGKLHLLRATGLGMTRDSEHAGRCVRIDLDGRVQTRRIVQSVAATGALVLETAFVDGAGQATSPPAGTAFEIVTLPAAHEAGEAVHEVLDEYVYLASDAPVEAVRGVEGYGVVEPEAAADGVRVRGERRGYVPVPPAYYRIETADSTTFPGLGRTVALVKLSRPPSTIAEAKFLDDALYLTVRGRPADGGGRIEHPVDILEHWLRTFGGLPAEALDADAFAAAKAARPDLVCGFALEEPRPAGALVTELAFQARLALLWEGGRATPRALQNDLEPAAATLDDAVLADEGVVLAEPDPAEAVTEVSARYTHRGETAAVVLRDEAAEGAFGRRARAIPGWAFGRRPPVRAMADFWLRRWSRPPRRLTVGTYLPGLAIERHDTVDIDHPAVFATPARGRVERIEHRAGRYAGGEADRIRLTLRLPQWGGCASSCEHACESGGCEASGCELSCTAAAETGCVWSCESACEEACELSCTATCELSCQGTCQLACQGGSESYACAGACESGCETACEGWACETSCETGCEERCQLVHIEHVSPVRQVRVLTPPATPAGAASVLQIDREGNVFGESFTAYDPFDVRPGANEAATVYLNFNYQWVLVPSHRDAKYVRVLDTTATSGLLEVIEQNHAGDTWGDPFLAWAVDSA